MKKQYLVTYWTGCYNTWSICALTLSADNDDEAVQLADRAWARIKRSAEKLKLTAIELFNLTDNREVKWREAA